VRWFQALSAKRVDRIFANFQNVNGIALASINLAAFAGDATARQMIERPRTIDFESGVTLPPSFDRAFQHRNFVRERCYLSLMRKVLTLR
jgi:hypothetical protein